MNRISFVVASWLLVAIVVIAAALFGVGGALVVAVPGVLAVFAAAFTSMGDAGPVPVRRIGEPAPVLEAPDPHAEPRSKRLGKIMIVAVMVHLVAALFINLTDLNHSVAPDTYAYRYCGVFLANSWADPSYDAFWSDESGPKPRLCVSYSPYSLYHKLNGVVEYVVGNEKFTHVFLGMMNGVIGVLAAYVMAQVARKLYGNYAEELTLMYIAFFPSLILWRSINLRESWSLFLVSTGIYYGIKLRERLTMRDLVCFGACLAVMPFIRSYLMVLFAAGTVLSYVAVRVRQIPTALLTLAILLLGVRFLAMKLGYSPSEVDLESGLAMVNRQHMGLAGGGSSFGTDVDLSTPTGALSYLPKGVFLFLFSPLPWTISSWREIATIPELLFWYLMLYRACRQALRSIRTDLVRIVLPVSVAVVMTLAWGLVEANGGTAYRHRAHVVIIALVFAAGDAAHRRAQQRAAVPQPALAEA